MSEINQISRRDLLKSASLGALVIGAESAVSAQEQSKSKETAAPKQKTEDRNKNITLPRRRLGRTNMMVTTISSGGVGIQDPAILERAIELGINYIDTAPAYGDSETVFGEVMKKRRGEVFLATKWVPLADWSVEQCLASLDKSLKRLQTDHIDLMQLHSVDTSPSTKDSPLDGYKRMDNPNLRKAMEKAKKDGKVRYFGVSSHNTNRKELLIHAIDTGLFDAILVAFNYNNYQSAGIADLLAHAKKHDIGVIGMKAGAGSISAPKAAPLTAQLAWVLTKDIHTVINSKTVQNEETLDHCLAAAKLKLAQIDRDSLERYAADTHSEYCRGCSHICETACPAEVRIADILRFEMYHKHYGVNHHEFAKQSYLELTSLERIQNYCGDCRKCEEACPYDLPIVDKMSYVERELA